MNNDDKIAIIDDLISMRGKVLRTAMTLKLSGGDSAPLDEAEQKLEAQVQELRGALQRQWQGEAEEVRRELQNASKRVQRRIADIDKKIKRAEKAVEILGQVEGLLAKIAPLLA